MHLKGRRSNAIYACGHVGDPENATKKKGLVTCGACHRTKLFKQLHDNVLTNTDSTKGIR